MMHVHTHGVGECGIYTFEVAETKVPRSWISPVSTSIRCSV